MNSLIRMVTVLAIIRSTLSAGVIKTYENISPTIYYDNLRCENGNPCGATWGSKWSDSIATGFAKCESPDTSIQKPYNYYKSNQFVAIDLNLFTAAGGYEKYCGKKVRVTKPDGTEYKSAGGDLFVWDSCVDCMTKPRVDFSAPDQLAMTDSTADKCGIGEPAYKVEILDESVAEYGGHPPDAPGGVDTFKGTDVGGAAVCEAAVGGNTNNSVSAGTTGVGSIAGEALAVSASSSELLGAPPAESSIAGSSVATSLALASPAVGAATIPAVQPAQSSAASVPVVVSLPSDPALAAPVVPAATSVATSVASTARGGYPGWGSSWTRD